MDESDKLDSGSSFAAGLGGVEADNLGKVDEDDFGCFSLGMVDGGCGGLGIDGAVLLGQIVTKPSVATDGASNALGIFTGRVGNFRG